MIYFLLFINRFYDSYIEIITAAEISAIYIPVFLH